MNIVYISKANSVNEVLGKWQSKLPYFIKTKIAKNKIYFKKQGEDIECKVFFLGKSKDKVLKNLGHNIKNAITSNEYKNVVISNELKENKILVEELRELNILNGRWLFNYLICDIINYILFRKDKQINQSEISILVNKTTDTNIQNILKIAKNVKILNIVTENISIFRQVEEKIYEEMGIMIRVTNNKRKSLLKSDIIINLDFSEDDINKYYLPSKRNNC